MVKLRPLLVGALLALTLPAKATIYTIGTGTASLTQNGVTPFGNYYDDNRTQYLFLASELTAAGASSGLITSLAFNFTSLATMAAENVNIKIGATTATTISGITEGLGVVYSAATVSPILGWNTFSFSTPFAWDGTSNILIEVCRDNSDYDENYGVAGMQYPAGANYTYGFYDDFTAGCSMTSGGSITAANRRRRPNVQLNIISVTPCSATPEAGLSASVASTCAATPFVLTATPEYAIGISFQYQVSTDGGATWNNLGTSSGSASYTITNQTAASQYRVIVACSSSGADTSEAVTVAQKAASECYCIPTYTEGCADGDDINDFILNGEGGSAINHTGSGCSAGSYGDFTSMSVDMIPGNTYTGSVGTSYPDPEEGYTIWVDWNNNGNFESGEQVATGMDISSSTPGNFTITVPAGTAAGTKRLRVRLAWAFLDGAPTNACTVGEYGETHDYTINIAASCTTPVVDLGADIAGCTGDTLTLNAGNPGATYLWNTGATTQTINITETGTYSVTVTDGDCAASDTLTVTFYEYPVVNLGADTAICAGETLLLNADNPGATFTWSTGDNTQTILVNAAGTYTVSVLNGVCATADTIHITEAVAPEAGTITATVTTMPAFDFSAAGTTGASEYVWDFGDGTVVNTATASHAYTANGVYEVMFIATNACGESDTATTTVTVSGVGINSVNGTSANVQVYPNPSNGLTVVEAKGALISNIEVMDNLGRIVLHTTPNTAKAVIDVKGMAQGIYTLRVHTNKGISTVKLVVKD